MSSDDPLKKLIEETDIAKSTKTIIYRELKKAGIIDPRAILLYTPEELSAMIKGVSETTARQLRDAVETLLGKKLFMTLAEKESLEEKQEFLTTGVKNLDELLEGGFPTGCFVELFGAPQAGKTQICYTLAARCVLPREKGGLDGGVLWIDTEGSFKSSRLMDVASWHGVDVETMKNKIVIVNARTIATLNKAIDQMNTILQDHDIRLVIIDSLLDPFRAEFSGLGQLAERQRVLNYTLHKIMRAAEAFNLIVIYTNHVMANPDPYASKPIQPVGGYVLGHASDIRIYLRRAPSAVRSQYNAPMARVAKIVDCAWLPEGEAVFSIGPFGICDPELESEHVKKMKTMRAMKASKKGSKRTSTKKNEGKVEIVQTA